MIKYIIVDDESVAHDIIEGYCNMLPNMQLMTNCYDAIEALDYLRRQSVDLIFLDLNMPVLKGFDFLRTLSNPPKVIVTTAYKEFALEGYELNIVDYLLKPFSFERFLKAINKATNVSSPATKPKPAPASTSAQKRRIFVRSNKRYKQLEIDDILYLEAAANYTKLITIDECITVREKIKDLLKKLPPKEFIQCHRSFVVAIQHINSIEANKIYIGEHNIPIGKLYKMKVNKLLQ